MTQTQVAPHPSRLSVETAVSIDVEKARVSVDSDEATIRVPFSTKRTSRKLFFTILLLANILFIALVVGLAVGLAMRVHSPSDSSSSSSSAADGESMSHGGGSGPSRHY
ncbi:hypothetical protein TWF281_004904 [Arthrobotrys megalospora]